MAEVVLFHHVQGLTDGVRAFADELRAGGHTVHTPDLFDGQRPATIDEGIELVSSLGDALATRCAEAVAGLPAGLVYAGFSWAARRRSGSRRPGRARAARCSTSRSSRCPPSGPSARGPPGSRSRCTAWTRTRTSPGRATWTPPASWSPPSALSVAELFTYPGDQHLFTDSSLPSYDPAATGWCSTVPWRSSAAWAEPLSGSAGLTSSRGAQAPAAPAAAGAARSAGDSDA